MVIAKKMHVQIFTNYWKTEKHVKKLFVNLDTSKTLKVIVNPVDNSFMILLIRRSVSMT